MKAYSWETIAELSKERAHCCYSDLTSSVVHGIEFSKFNEASIKNKVGWFSKVMSAAKKAFLTILQ